MQCACAVLSSVACSALSHNGKIFEIKNTEHKMCVLIFSTTFVRNDSYFKKSWARYNQKCILGVM
jgi:hypothetical protein